MLFQNCVISELTVSKNICIPVEFVPDITHSPGWSSLRNKGVEEHAVKQACRELATTKFARAQERSAVERYYGWGVDANYRQAISATLEYLLLVL